jgi:hypothetical protein
MSIGILKYTWQLGTTIRKAKRHGAITPSEADYLSLMAKDSVAASSTAALINADSAPDFLYAALHFSTMIWQLGESAGHSTEAEAGYKLALYAMSQESVTHDPYWVAKLLRELYEAHEESMQAEFASHRRAG